MWKFKSRKNLILGATLVLSAVVYGCGRADTPLAGIGGSQGGGSTPGGLNDYWDNCQVLSSHSPGSARTVCSRYVPFANTMSMFPSFDVNSVVMSDGSGTLVEVKEGEYLQAHSLGMQESAVCTMSTGKFWIFSTYSSSCSASTFNSKFVAGVDDSKNDLWAEVIPYSLFRNQYGQFTSLKRHRFTQSGRLHLGFKDLDPNKNGVYPNLQIRVYYCRDGSNKRVACPSGI